MTDQTGKVLWFILRRCKHNAYGSEPTEVKQFTSVDGSHFPFGETFAHEHSNTQRTPYRFTGKEYDEVTGLYYYGARYYDPRTSVWQSPDPIFDQYFDGKPNHGIFNPENLQLYTYAANNPIVNKDPNGEWVWKSVADLAINVAIGYATEGKLTWSVVKTAAAETAKDAVNPMATVNKAKKLAKVIKTFRQKQKTDKANSSSAKIKKQRNKPPAPLSEAEGRPHTIIEKPGPQGQYTTHNGDGTFKQYRGSGKDHGNIPRPNIKENTLNRAPDGRKFVGAPKVRPTRADEIPGGN